VEGWATFLDGGEGKEGATETSSAGCSQSSERELRKNKNKTRSWHRQKPHCGRVRKNGAH
jgi:hypothetical protein